MFKTKLLNFLKNIGNGIGAIGYYFSTILISLLIAIAVVAISFLSLYSNITNDYSEIQIAWNELDKDLNNDLSFAKVQLEQLKALNVDTSLYYSETNKNLSLIDATIQDIDNAMTYQEKINAYPKLETVLNDLNAMTKYIDKDNTLTFDTALLLENNQSLKNTYNEKCNYINKKLSHPQYKIIKNVFSLHEWKTL